MLFKVFDDSHEKGVENSINSFLLSDIELIDIKYSVAITAVGEDQIYCFTALVLYRKLSED